MAKKKDFVDVELRLTKGHAEFIADLAKIGGISQSDVVCVILALTIYRERLHTVPANLAAQQGEGNG